MDAKLEVPQRHERNRLPRHPVAHGPGVVGLNGLVTLVQALGMQYIFVTIYPHIHKLSANTARRVHKSEVSPIHEDAV